jgi:hypothetical protein
MPDSPVGLTGRVIAVLTNADTGQRHTFEGRNIVTNDGDKYYAQMACGEAPDDDFDAAAAGIRLGTGFSSADKDDTDVDSEDSNGRLDVDSGYPKTDDDDGDNSGAGVDVVSWRFSYATGEGNISGIDECAIVDNRTTPTAALCHAEFSPSFTKTSADTLKIFVNHTFNGT